MRCEVSFVKRGTVIFWKAADSFKVDFTRARRYKFRFYHYEYAGKSILRLIFMKLFIEGLKGLEGGAVAYGYSY